MSFISNICFDLIDHLCHSFVHLGGQFVDVILLLPSLSIQKIKLVLNKWMRNLFRFGWNSSSTASWRHLEEILIFNNKQVNSTLEKIKKWWNTKWIMFDLFVKGFRGVLEGLANYFLKALWGNPLFFHYVGRSLSRNH